MTIKKIYKIIEPRQDPFTALDSQDVSGSGGAYGAYGWYHRLVQGSSSRSVRYREYDVMDNDTDVSAALDIIAEEVTGNTPKSEEPLVIKITSENEQMVASSLVVTLKAALKTWSTIQDWNKRLYPTVRQTLKYGDTFYIRPTTKKFDKLLHIHPRNVIGAIVPENDATKVIGWNIKTDYRKAAGMAGVNSSLSFAGATDANAYNVENFSANDVIRFTMNSDMSDEAPFGESIFKSIYKTFKQKELLEDAVLIYRIQRAPERRVFKIETGKMPPNRVAQHLEQVKNEFRQKKVPASFEGKNSIEAVYNPQSQNEDFFLSMRDGVGSTIETLPSGQNLGELQDLDYFYKKMWRGLRIPQSYMDSSSDGGTFNDGTVGVAYMQEIIFTLMIERYQKQIEETLDKEFKRFLYEQNIRVDTTVFRVTLPEPSNFAKSKQQAIDNQMINLYTSVMDVDSLSDRFKLKRFLGLSEEEIILNQRLKLEEMGINPDTAKKSDLIKIYNKDFAEAGGFDGGMGGDPSLDVPLDDGDMDGEEGMDEEGMDEEGMDTEDMDAGEEKAPNNEEIPIKK